MAPTLTSYGSPSVGAIMLRLITFMLLALAALSPRAADDYPEIKWEALVPKDWDPARDLKGLDLATLKDSDPRAMEALQKMKEAWDNAPVEPGLNGKKVRIAGFAIPLERKGDKATEFLLVPYFGACIHSPPPPANQIIHAVAKKAVSGMKSMDTVWVSGTLGLQRANTPWGAAGYRLTVERVTPYEMPKRK